MSKDIARLFEDINSSDILDSGFTYFKGEVVSRSTFIKHVYVVAQNLPKSSYVINLCEDRYLFSLVFIAGMIRKNICLLPSSQVESEIENLKDDYNDCTCINDADISIEKLVSGNHENVQLPEFNLNQLACIVFTSGSTGKPKPNEKTWGALLSSAKLVSTTLGLLNENNCHIVATVPPQHMFGFEISIMLPMVTSIVVHWGKPFFPQEVCHALAEFPAKRILVTTPIHLKALVSANLDWPEIEFILSATSILERELALEVEAKLKTKVKEIYGCSEAGAIASRVVSESEYWKLLPGYEIKNNISGYEVILPEEHKSIILNDNFEFNNEGNFLLLGRESDMVKVAGKRGSLGDLKNKMCSITGVLDAVFFMPDSDINKGRIAALVIVDGNKKNEILAILAKKIDPVFLPRPLIKVDKIPYNSMGKITRNKLLEVLHQYKNKNGYVSRCIGD